MVRAADFSATCWVVVTIKPPMSGHGDKNGDVITIRLNKKSTDFAAQDNRTEAIGAT
jgi:hypothetical protein